MPKYDDDHSDKNQSAHSLDSEYGGLDLPITKTPGAKKSLTTENEKLSRSNRENNPISRFGYNDYMANHFAFMMKVATAREPESFAEAARIHQMGRSDE